MNCSKVASQNAFVTLILLMIQLPSSQMLTNAHKIFTTSNNNSDCFPIPLTRQRENQNSTEHTNSQHVGLDRAPSRRRLC